MRRQDGKIEGLLAGSRKVTDGRGNVVMYTGHACPHYEEIPIVDADEAIQTLMRFALRDKSEEMPPFEDTPAMREAVRIFVGYGLDADRNPLVAVCHDSKCYPGSWPDGQIAACEVHAHEVVTTSHHITAVTIPGPRAYCRKVCYATTPHFFDVEVWSEGSEPLYQIILRCEQCHHGYDHVTKIGSPSRWRRLMQNETARRVLAGAVPHREVA